MLMVECGIMFLGNTTEQNTGKILRRVGEKTEASPWAQNWNQINMYEQTI